MTHYQNEKNTAMPTYKMSFSFFKVMGCSQKKVYYALIVQKVQKITFLKEIFNQFLKTYEWS
jgi:hypothetical protein